MKRKFYFIKDSVTGDFYTGQSVDYISTFDKAAVYFQRKNAEKKIKEYIDDKYTGSWRWHQNYLARPDIVWTDEMINFYKKMIDERKDLPNWGIEIVEVEVNAP